MTVPAVASAAERERAYQAFLQVLAPTRDTHTLGPSDIGVEGCFPSELSGTLYRVGASQRTLPENGSEGLHLFDGDGLVHAFEIDGTRVDYTSRFVENESFRSEQAAGRVNQHLLGYTARDPDPRVFVRAQHNTNIVQHADRLLALVESSPPFELEPGALDPIGPFTLGGRMLGMSVAAHPKRDPSTGELVMHAHQFMPPFLALYALDAQGRTKLATYVAGPHPAMVHDLAITPRFVILPAGEISMSPQMGALGVTLEDSLVHRPEHGLWFVICSRETGEQVSCLPAPSGGQIFHLGNAFEHEDGRIELDAMLYRDVPELLRFLRHVRGGRRFSHIDAELVTYVLDPAAGTVSERFTTVRAAEYPRFDERRMGTRHRHLYACENDPGEPVLPWKHLIKIDRDSGAVRRIVLAATEYPSEPVFVARHDSTDDDDGYLLSVITDGSTDESRLCVFDARSMAPEPIASAQLPIRIPFTFHGNFVR